MARPSSAEYDGETLLILAPQMRLPGWALCGLRLAAVTGIIGLKVRPVATVFFRFF
jgi:hypothetical protein